MTIYDGAMLVLLLGGLAWGAWRGITWQVASLASLVLGYTGGVPLSAQLAPQLPGEPLVARGVALVISYVGVSGAIFFVAWLIRATLRKIRFEAYDRHLGMILGGAEGFLLGIIGTLLIVSVAPQSRMPIFNSFSGKFVGRVLATVEPILPEEAGPVLKPFWEGQAEVVAEKPQPFTIPDSVDLKIPIDTEKLEEAGTKLGRALIEEAEQTIERVGRTNDRNSPRR